MKQSELLKVKEVIDALLTQKEHVIIAIDGQCGSGKTTLGQLLHEHYGGNLFHMDDFYLQPYQRTEERLNETGGNVDYERFYEEVIQPVLNHQAVNYRPFDCVTMTLKESQYIPDAFITIIEGSYSLHPYFKDPYDLKIVVEISNELQKARLKQREGAHYIDFETRWIPKENAYFETMNIKNGALLVRGDD